MSRRRASAGFTLTELLVASGLSTLMLAGLLVGEFPSGC